METQDLDHQPTNVHQLVPATLKMINLWFCLFHAKMHFGFVAVLFHFTRTQHAMAAENCKRTISLATEASVLWLEQLLDE